MFHCTLPALVFTSAHSPLRRLFFFFQAEDGIRDVAVTGVQTCALPISRGGGCGRGVARPAAGRRVRGTRQRRRVPRRRTHHAPAVARGRGQHQARGAQRARRRPEGAAQERRPGGGLVSQSPLPVRRPVAQRRRHAPRPVRALAGPAAVAPPVPPTAHVLLPDEPEAPPLPGRAWGGGARLAAPRAVRAATYVAGALLGAAGLGLLYRLVARPSAVALGAAAEVTSPSAPDRVDRVADTLALAVAAFDARARLFDHHQMGCPELGRGLVVLEEWWIAYNAARKQASALDSAHGARDRSLYSDIDAVERRFERSRCPRP